MCHSLPAAAGLACQAVIDVLFVAAENILL
jgi:hypothetical protein